MKLKYLFYELLAIPLLVPLLHNNVFSQYINDVWFDYLWSRDISNVQTNYRWDYSYSIDNLWNFKTVKDNIEHNFLYFTVWWNPNRYLVLWRKDSQLYVFMTQTNTAWSITIQYQWFVSWYAILPSWYEFNTWWNIKNDIPLTWDWNFIKSLLWNYNIIWFHANNKNDSSNAWNSASSFYWNFMFLATNYVSNYCLITDDDVNHYICFWNSTWISNTNLFENNLTWSLDKTTTNRNDITQFDTFFNEDSPIVPWWWWWWSSWWDLVELTSPYSVRDVLYAYWEMWYTNWLCYWNFALNDLAVSWTIDQFFDQDIEDGVYYTWANIFQLYDTYSWWYNFNTYMNSLLARFYPSYNNNTALWFIWLSKWLWYNQYLIYIHRSTIQDFSYQNLYNYCYFAIAIDQWSISLDDNFNKDMINKWSLPISVQENLDSPWVVLVPWDDSLLDFSWSDNWWPNRFSPWDWPWWWWWSSWWDDTRDAYTTFVRLYNSIAWMSSHSLWDSKTWFLPSVIAFALWVSLLFYWLKR